MPLMMNPYNPSKAGKNTRLDIMGWDWYGRHESQEWIRENQYDIFQ